MVRNIDQAFEELHNKIKTSISDTAGAKSHRSSIEACLKNNFGLKRFVRIGSFGNGTNISGYSDVDYLACLPTDKLKLDSYYSLSIVKQVLANRFTSTNINVSTPAVVCPFGTYRGEDTEIVIADYITERNGFKVYEIADGNKGWMEISPDAHNHYVSEIDKKHNGKVKKLIRFIKAWKYYNSVPIKSFYLEMKIAKYASNEPAIVYNIDIKNIFKILLNENLASMQDPMGVSGYITPCNTDSQKTEALSKINTAVSRSEKAVFLDDEIEKFKYWNLLFCNKFPSRYY
ncbi:SMODS domain-containing nucleotidyltransferase [Proteus faecis]|uniref:SMODS domain-containing nucleotidyltransferase n=1 Tax=Proteus faecis TaxID=2050967 RepID=UPI00301D0119